MYINSGDYEYAQWQMVRHKAICKGERPPTLLAFRKSFKTGEDGILDGMYSMMREKASKKLRAGKKSKDFDWKHMNGRKKKCLESDIT